MQFLCMLCLNTWETPLESEEWRREKAKQKTEEMYLTLLPWQKNISCTNPHLVSVCHNQKTQANNVPFSGDAWAVYFIKSFINVGLCFTIVTTAVPNSCLKLAYWTQQNYQLVKHSSSFGSLLFPWLLLLLSTNFLCHHRQENKWYTETHTKLQAVHSHRGWSSNP